MQQQSHFYSYLLDNNGQQTQQDHYYNNGNFNNGPNVGDAAMIDTQQQQPQQPSAESSTSAAAAAATAPLKGGTDFRRRKNWSERILVEIIGLLHVLSPTGKILYCSESTHELTGYRPHELVGQALMDFLHVDDMDVFIRDFQMSFHARSQIKTHYRFRKKDDTFVIFEVVGHPKSDIPGQSPQSFFGIAQPVPTKSGALIDAFLELKAENNWLKKRIDELSAKYGKISMSSSESNSPLTAATASTSINTLQQQHSQQSQQQQHNDDLLHHHQRHHQIDTSNNSNTFNNKSINTAIENWMDTHNNELDEYMFNNKDEKEYNQNNGLSTSLHGQESSDRKDKWKRRVSLLCCITTSDLAD